MRRYLLATTLAAALVAAPGARMLEAQSIGSRIRSGAHSVSDALHNAVKCVADDSQCIQTAQAQGKPVTVTDANGQPVSTADSARAIQNASASSSPAPAATGTATATTNDAPAAASSPPGQGAWLNYDFVPGERVLWFEDFSGDDVGDFPRRMSLISGNLEVVNVNGKKYLHTVEGGQVVIVLPDTLPQRFTVEFRYHGPTGGNPAGLHTTWSSDFADFGCYLFSAYVDAGMGGAQSAAEVSDVGENDFVNCRFTISDRYIKAYINEHRLANVPTTRVAHTDSLYIQLPGYTAENPTLITDIRIAAGGRRLYDALAATGRVATQGILFDTGSDRIRGESTPTLTEIGQMLKDHPELRLTIEGHTDNVGAAAANQSLSERRAAAVKAYLVQNFQVDAARLASAGFGASRPAAPNTTPEGRQTNRRVELVRM